MKRWLLVLLVLLAAPADAGGRLAGVEVQGSELVVRAGDGRAIRGTGLAGAVLSMSLDGRSLASVRIDDVRGDARARTDDVLVYALSVRDPDGSWQPACAPDPFGERLAILQPAPDGAIAIWCTAGTYAKCIRFGYRPWAKGPHGEPLARYHLACNKMLRADYCGDDEGTTRTGMLVDIFDTIGINAPTTGRDDLHFEAAWNEDGAVCVAHPRVPQNIDLARLARGCPRLRGRLGTFCTPENAARFGTPLLFNASRGDGVTEAERQQP